MRLAIGDMVEVIAISGPAPAAIKRVIPPGLACGMLGRVTAIRWTSDGDDYASIVEVHVGGGIGTATLYVQDCNPLPKLPAQDSGAELRAAQRRIADSDQPAVTTSVRKPLTFHVTPEMIRATKERAARDRAEAEAARVRRLEELKAKAAADAAAKSASDAKDPKLDQKA